MLAQPAADRRPAELLRGYSIEVTARNRRAAETCRASLPAGTEVYLAFVPGDSHHTVVETATRVRAAGFVPVPHVSARSIASFTQLDDFLERLGGEAGVTQALVVGGDVARPAGPFESSLQLLEAGRFRKHGIRRVGLAVHPEAHRAIAAEDLDAALTAKLAVLEEKLLEPWLVTQFCFEPAPIVRRVARLRAQGVTAPVRVGVAGPADRHTLWKYALHCGIGNSVRALGAHVEALRNLLAVDTPHALLADLADAARRDPTLGIAGVHIFTFGGVAATARWAEARLAGR